ncbi:MAG TPA: hypothetical protein VLF39_03720 [Candidatus Saccharimonadales bacterium]|nr:hypothetical protein [Candidatus Saccharimonadales bacterium]
MYFNSRAEAGRLIASKLTDYQTKNSTIIALSRGAVLVGAQIAVKLHCNIMMLMTENIDLPGEPVPLAAMASDSGLTYNHAYSDGELDEFNMEFFNFIEQQRLEKIHRLHTLMDASGQVNRDLLRYHVVIVVSDGLSTGLSLDVATDYLKPIKINKLIVACPVATPQALDRMRLFADEVHCLNVTDNYIDTDHYYEDNTIPNKDGIYKIIQDISLNWERPNPVRAKTNNKNEPEPKVHKSTDKEDDKTVGKLVVKHETKEPKSDDKPKSSSSKSDKMKAKLIKVISKDEEDQEQEETADTDQEGIMLIRH